MSYADQVAAIQPAMPVQFNGGSLLADVHRTASEGVSGSGSALPHGDRIQQSFGHHDVSSVNAHVGGKAAVASESLGAMAYATGNDIAFKSTPDLHTAAHEAAHVVQQRSGVNLPGGVGSAGDSYEKHADAVADRVVSGQSAEDLLSGSGSGGAVQTKAIQKANPDPLAADPELTDAELPSEADIRGALTANPTGHPAWTYFSARVAAFAPHVDATAMWTSIMRQYVAGLPAASISWRGAGGIDQTRDVWSAALGITTANLDPTNLPPAALYTDVVRTMFDSADFGQVPGTGGFGLWSGGQLAQQYAQNRGYTTLESTVAGRVLNNLKILGDGDNGWNVLSGLWAQMSTKYAETVTGEVHCFQATQGPIFTNFEKIVVDARNAVPGAVAVTFKYHALVSTGPGRYYANIGEVNQTGTEQSTESGWQAQLDAFNSAKAGYEAKTVDELKQLCRDRSISRYSRLRKNELIMTLISNDGLLYTPYTP